MFYIKIICIQGSVNEWMINVYKSTRWIYKCCCLVLFIVRVDSDSSFLARLCTWITLKHTLNLFTESFQLTWHYSRSHFLLSGVRCKVASAKDGWSSPIAGMGRAGAGGVVSQSSGSALNSTWVSSSLALLVSPMTSSIVPSKTSYEEPAILLFAHTVTLTMHERC